MKIGRKTINDDNIFFIIEEGQANWGDFDKALKMVDYAVEAGGDAIEFQFVIPRDLYVKDHEYIKIYEKTQFPIDKMTSIVKYAKNKGIEVIVVLVSTKLVKPMIDAGCSAFNINATDINNPEIIDAVCESGLPFFVSLPLASEEEIEWIINRLNSNRAEKYVLLHGQHTMAAGEHGVSPIDTSLGYIETLKEKYKKKVGFIDHSALIWMPACAIAAGANVVSKHLCISRDDKGPDWQVCLEPDEMKQSINIAQSIKSSLITKNKMLAPGEKLDIAIMRRSIVAKNKIEKGQIIKREDIAFKRPGTGISPSKYNEVIGKITKIGINEDEIITNDKLQ